MNVPLPDHLRAGGPLLEGRRAVVTGGAGSIGDAICQTLASHGADIVVADIDAARTADTVAAIEALGRRGHGVVGDLTSRTGMDALVEATMAAFGGGPDILVNNLGHHLASAGPFEESDEDVWQALYEVNLLHTMRATKAFLPGMKERGWGRVVNFSSVEGIRSAPGLTVYTAFKAAIDAFTKSLAVDMARFGIRVNAIAVDKTRSHQVDFYRMPPEYDRHVPVWIPAGRFGEGPDVAAVALFLSSELSSWVVGQTIVADGGTLSAGGWFRTPARWTNSPLLIQHIEDPAATAERPPGFR